MASNFVLAVHNSSSLYLLLSQNSHLEMPDSWGAVFSPEEEHAEAAWTGTTEAREPQKFSKKWGNYCLLFQFPKKVMSSQSVL